MDAYAQSLLRSEPLRKPLFETLIASLHLPPGSRGLDVGCGIGLQTLLLAQAAGRSGHVTGIDISPAFLELANESARQAGLTKRVAFQPGRWDPIPYERDTFDWAWSADAAGYASPDPVPVVKELVRVVKPRGRVLLVYWSSQTLLPGYPALEARLNASKAGIAPFAAGAPPETHYLRALGWLREAGCTDLRAETVAQTIAAPLADDLRDALTALFEMRWGAAKADVVPKDWREYQRLCLPTSPDFILSDPAYYAFFTYSVFSGQVPKKGR